MASGIYVIENNITHHKYVGQGEDAEKRMWYYHRGCKALLDAFKVYGEENFTRYIIEYCSIDDLDEREIFWIKELHSHTSEGGYNLSWGGDSSMRGLHHTDEWKRKMSIAKSGENAYWYGKHFPEETLRRMSESRMGNKNHNYGKPKSEKTKKLMSDAQKGEKAHNYGKFGKENGAFGMKHKNSSSKYFSVSIAKKTKRNCQMG